MFRDKRDTFPKLCADSFGGNLTVSVDNCLPIVAVVVRPPPPHCACFSVCRSVGHPSLLQCVCQSEMGGRGGEGWDILAHKQVTTPGDRGEEREEGRRRHCWGGNGGGGGGFAWRRRRRRRRRRDERGMGSERKGRRGGPRPKYFSSYAAFATGKGRKKKRRRDEWAAKWGCLDCVVVCLDLLPGGWVSHQRTCFKWRFLLSATATTLKTPPPIFVLR